ncbi:MAG: polyphosphate kinase 2 family protein [Acidimicrobiia bacterium]
MPDELVVKPGEQPGLARRDPAATLGLDGKDAAAKETSSLIAELAVLHNRLWAERRRSLLLVLQGMDASGKDGTIRHVFTGLNPQGCSVVSFKAPNDEELAHDYLWRVHALVPRRGYIGIFNRSHYEDVVTARMIGVIDDDEADRRCRQIRDFERTLVEEGTTIVKVFLHVSRAEQARRLQERLDDPEKRWKFNRADLDVRAQWDAYHQRYESALHHTSTEHAPWHVVPADRKWVRNVAVARLLVHALRRMDPKVPPGDPGLDGLTVA